MLIITKLKESMEVKNLCQQTPDIAVVIAGCGGRYGYTGCLGKRGIDEVRHPISCIL